MGGSHVLLKGTPDPLPSLGCGGQCWFWKTLDPRLVRSGPGLASEAPATRVDPVPRPTCASAQRLPLLRACLPARLPAAGSCGERRVRAGNHQAPQPAAPTPFPPPPSQWGRGGLRTHPQVLKKGPLASRTRGN